MFQKYMKERIFLVETRLKFIMQALNSQKDLTQAMEYSLMAGGKRLRPIMLMSVVDAFGGNGSDYIDTACALEFIHTYSLIHDDLPAMDDDDLRRGKPTCHKVFGEAVAILAGDALLTHAFLLIAEQQNASDLTKVKLIRELSSAAGLLGMVGGQAIDIEQTNNCNSFTESDLIKMHSMKTGALFCAAIRMGAMLASADEKKIDLLTDYAKNFGLAFQITDDILDVTGNEALLGKPIGSDNKNDKTTYLSFFSVDKARNKAQKAIEDAQRSISFLGEKAAFLEFLLTSLIKRQK